MRAPATRRAGASSGSGNAIWGQYRWYIACFGPEQSRGGGCVVQFDRAAQWFGWSIGFWSPGRPRWICWSSAGRGSRAGELIERRLDVVNRAWRRWTRHPARRSRFRFRRLVGRQRVTGSTSRRTWTRRRKRSQQDREIQRHRDAVDVSSQAVGRLVSSTLRPARQRHHLER